MADFVAEVFCPSECVKLIQDQASMRNVDSRIHSLRFDCCIFLFYSLSAMTFATQSVHGDATDAGQLNFRFAALAKARIESISRLICASKAAGVIGIGSMPCGASFSRTPGAANAFRVSWESLSTISRGVLAGTNSPVQNV